MKIPARRENCAPFPPRERPRRARGGFVFFLMFALFVCAILAALILPLKTLIFAHANHASAEIGKKEADAAVRAGTLAALGELQAYAGTDCATTAEIAGKTGEMPTLGVWNSSRLKTENLERAVLISNRGDLTNAETRIFRDPDRRDREIEVPWENFGENARIAWFVRDESLRAPVRKYESDAFRKKFEEDEETLMRVRQQISRESNLSDLLDTATETNDFRFRRARAFSREAFLEEPLADFARSRAREARSALTAQTLGVPADWPRNRLKIDLCDEENFSEISDLVPAEVLKTFSEESEEMTAGTKVAGAPAETSGSLGHFSHPFPIPVELKLHLGFFNPRSDGQHRVRFHVTARFWNPYAFPLLVRSSDRFGLFDVENLPMIYVENENTGGNFTFSPSEFPIGQYGLVKQTPSDRTTNAYCRIFDSTSQGFGSGGSTLGIHAGEVFLARFPDPSSQSYGLARNTGGSSWKYQKDATKPTKAPSGANGNAWFNPVHVIRISSLPSFFLSSFLIRADAGSLGSQVYPEYYSEPVVTFKNVYFPAFDFSMSGEDYNRQVASAYDISQASLVWKIRLKTEDEAAMKKLFETVEVRRGEFDFSVPAVANAFEVSTLTGTEAAAEADVGADGETAFPLNDAYVNEHAAGTKNAFSCVRLFDLPQKPVLSAGALRHLAFSELATAFSVGAAFPSDAAFSSPNALLDRVHFADAGHNPHLAEIDGNLFVSGAFNINSENASAWAAILPHNVPAWRATGIFKNTSKSAEKNFENAFFTQPHTANIALAGTGRDVYTDAELARLSASEREAAVFSQGVRELSQSRIMCLAESIVTLLGKRRAAGIAPFASMQEFADSGILEEAIEDCSLNTVAGTKIPFWAPAFISQAALIESLAPVAFPRGDTFTIYCRAEVFDRMTKKQTGAACAAMRVQRLPEFFDSAQSADTKSSEQNALNRAFGRRFKITEFRTLPPDAL